MRTSSEIRSYLCYSFRLALKKDTKKQLNGLNEYVKSFLDPAEQEEFKSAIVDLLKSNEQFEVLVGTYILLHPHRYDMIPYLREVYAASEEKSWKSLELLYTLLFLNDDYVLPDLEKLITSDELKQESVIRLLNELMEFDDLMFVQLTAIFVCAELSKNTKAEEIYQYLHGIFITAQQKSREDLFFEFLLLLYKTGIQTDTVKKLTNRYAKLYRSLKRVI